MICSQSMVDVVEVVEVVEVEVDVESMEDVVVKSGLNPNKVENFHVMILVP